MGDELAVNVARSTADHSADTDKSSETKPKPKPPGRQEASTGASVAVGSKDSGRLTSAAGTELSNGDAGFSRQLLAQTNATANALDGWKDVQLHNVLPWTQMAEWQVRQRSREKQEQLDKVAGTFWGLTEGSVSSDTTYKNAAAFCEQHATQIHADVADEHEKFTSYNSWVPRANGYFSSLMRLRAQEKMLGVTDIAALVQQLGKGLGDMSQVAARMQLASDKGNAPNLQMPPGDNTLETAGVAAMKSGRDMRVAYLHFQQTLLAAEKVETLHEGDKDSARLAQINENKDLVQHAGKAIDITMSVIDGAPGAVATATTKMNRFGAGLGAAANKRQLMNGMRPTHNPTYVTIDAQGNMIVRNVQTGIDRSMTTKPGEPYAQAPSPEAEGSMIPAGIGDLMGKIADFAYAGEVKKINFHLETIKTRCVVIQSTIDANNTKIRIQTFQNALNDFAEKCADLQKRMEARRQQYLEFGVQLDNFARTDQGSQKAGLSPSKGGERYATIMTVASTVREVLSMGRSVAGSFDSTDQLREWATAIVERRERTDDGRQDISMMWMPGAELQRMTNMYEQVKMFENNYARQKENLGPIETAAHQALTPLMQGGNSGGTY